MLGLIILEVSIHSCWLRYLGPIVGNLCGIQEVRERMRQASHNSKWAS